VKLGLSHSGKNIGLKVYENMVLRKVSGPKRDKVTTHWGRMHKEELHDLSSAVDIQADKSIRIRWLGFIARVGQRRGAYTVFMRKPEGKRPLGRPGCRLEDSTKIELVGGQEWDGCSSGQGQIAGSCEHSNEPLGSKVHSVTSHWIVILILHCPPREPQISPSVIVVD
jgi:hypothetical protein